MRDQRKTKAQLIDELRELRARLDSIEATRTDAQSEIDALYRRVVELSPDPFAVLQDGIVKFASPSFETVFGYTQEDIARGMSITSFVSDKDREILVQRVNDRLAGKDVSKHFQIDVIAKDGHIVHCETAGVVMEFEGRPADLVLTLDVTDRVKMEMELRATRSDLETKVAQRTAELKAANRQLWEEIAERGRIMETLRESEEYIRAILESTADGILVVDKENKVTHLNARFAELWKIPSELLETRNDRKLLEYAADQLEHPKVFLDAVRYLYGTKDTSFDTIRFKDGRVIERYTTPLLKDNSVEGRVWSFRDVTDRYRAYEEAYKFKTISDNANYGVAMVALDGTLLYLNDTFANMYGYERNELIGTSLRDLHTGDQLLQVERLTRLAINRGGFKAEELWRTKKDGTEHPALLSGTMIRDDQGRPLFFSITAIDTTELHRSQKERAAFESELQKSQRMESLGRMAAAVAHDFNNILTLIMGYVDIAATALPQDAETRDYIERIFSAGHQARDIIDQILAFAREETRDETPVLVHLVVKEVLSLIEPAIPPTVTVRRHIDAAAGSVRIGAMQIHRAVANLCTNALYAMKQDGGVLELRVERVDVDPETARSVSNLHAGPYVRVTVSDTGTGIPPDIMDRVFEPFFSTKPQTDGMGLGLSTVSGIVTTHGGAIDLKSQPGQGTTAAIYLPRADDMLTIEPKSPPGPLSTGTERILLVDDEPNVLNMVRIMLEKLGYIVTSTASEMVSIDLFQSASSAIDVVIVDQIMPLIRGTDLAKRFIDIRPDIPVILMTGINNAVDRDTIETIGLRGYIRKPVTARSLGNAVRHVLDGHTHFEI